MTVHKNIPVGLELYSVGNMCKEDFAGTIEAVAKMGYKGVEFAGYWGRSAKELRKMVDDNGLVTCGTHTPYADLQPDKLEATIEFNRVIGNKFVICPYMSGNSRADYLDKAREFNGLAEKLRPHGMWIGYHAHGHDFRRFDGETAWDIFFGNTKSDVVMQMDPSNCRDGGADPVQVLQQYPGRARTIHLKANGGGPEAVIGEDKIDWKGLFEFCETKGGTEWYIVEHETSKDPLDAVRRMFEAIRSLGKA
jgi:sugar phosphate isomerase/epimerase